MKLIKGLKNAGRNHGPARSAAAETKPLPQPISTAKSTASGSRKQTVTIEAKIDVGFGNSLYLRGEGAGLDWNRGIPLANVDGATWKWSCEAAEALKFKLLLNDAVWSQGEDLVARPGQKVEVAPNF
jgi:hypothetical protein